MWIKQGRIFNLDSTQWRTNHSQVPTPYVMQDRIRIYYSCRADGQSFIAYFDLAKDLKTILDVHEESIMPSGQVGCFDDNGIMPSCVIKDHEGLKLYYIGWNSRNKGARYHNEIGLAVSNDNGESFTRRYEGAVMGRTLHEPGLCVMPFVMYKNWYRMWYQSTLRWENVDGKYEPVYVIKYAESMDGVKWERFNEQCVPSNYPNEAFSRPSVIIEDDIYKMWFCVRDSKSYRDGDGSYKIGYAESVDGKKFVRMDDRAGISMGEDGEFDSDMQCYPYIVDVDGQRVMFYNGNSFGQTGIGLAVWKD